jgi:hypothetical protein
VWLGKVRAPGTARVVSVLVGLLLCELGAEGGMGATEKSLVVRSRIEPADISVSNSSLAT